MGLLNQAAAAVTGGSSPTLALFTIRAEKPSSDGKNPLSQLGDELKCQFNPSSLQISQESRWTVVNQSASSQGDVQFGSQGFESLAFDLYFDTTEGDSSDDSSGPTDVRLSTAPIAILVQMVPHLHRPPVCALSWGEADPQGINWFNGVATSIRQAFTYFDNTGMPLRAKLSCGFMEVPKESAVIEKKSNDLHKVYIVQRGDTLASIAKRLMHNVSLWRHIAQANGITDPLVLKPGRVLHIPTVERW
jgi:LysM repeat protein